MGKLLETKLPVSIGEVSSETFNRLVRVLELSLNRVDVDSTLTVNETQRNQNKFYNLLSYQRRKKIVKFLLFC